MDYKHMTAPCGLPCFECPAHEQGLCKGCRNEKGKCGSIQCFAGFIHVPKKKG